MMTDDTSMRRCADTDPELFFDPLQIATAKRLCSACPFVNACRKAGQDEWYGVWGGEVKQGTAMEATALLAESVFDLLAQGMSRKAIAREWGISDQAVRGLIARLEAA